jgi:hypothetical protein
MIIMLKTPILKVDLSASICTKCLMLQNGLQVNEILIILNFQVNENLKKYLCIVKLCML